MSDNEPSKSGGFWDRVKATKFAIESIAFEHQALKKKDEKDWIGLCGVALIWVISVIFLYEYLQGKSPLFPKEEAQTFSGVLHYISAFSSQSFWTLLKPDFNSLSYSPPLYYLLYVPVIKFITSDLKMAMLVVNSLFLLLLAFMPFYAVKPTRGWIGGLLASAAVMACPFVTQAAREPNSSIALIAIVAGLYCSYMCYKELVENKWPYYIALFIVAGFYTSGYFWIFVLPLLHPLSIGMMNYVNSGKFFNVLVPGFLINVTWYVLFIIMLIAGFMPIRGEYQGIFGLLKGTFNGLGLPMLLIGGLALVWLNFNSFNPYEKKKEIIMLFVLPWAALTFAFCPSDSALLYPALIALPIAASIMMPFRLEKIMAGVFICLFVANSLSAPVSLAGITLFGCEGDSSKMPHQIIISSIRENLPQGASKTAVYSTDGSLNAESLSFIFEKNGKSSRFINEPPLPNYSDLILNKTSPDGKNNAEFDKLKTDPGFAEMFMKKDIIPCDDGSNIEIYAKTGKNFDILQEGKRYPIGTIKIGSFSAKGVTLKIDGYNPQERSYSGVLSAGTATLYGGDIYALKVEVSGLKFTSLEGAPVISDIAKARIASARVSAYGIEGMVRHMLPFIKEPSVRLAGNLMHVSGSVKGHPVFVQLAMSVPKPGIVEIKPVDLSIGGVNMPGGTKFLLNIFNYRFNASENAYALSLNSINMNNEIMEIK